MKKQIKERPPDASSQTEGSATKTDEEVLKEMEEQNTAASASSQFQNYQWQREESNNRKYEELMTIAGDLSKTPEENAKATEELRALEEKKLKLTALKRHCLNSSPMRSYKKMLTSIK